MCYFRFLCGGGGIPLYFLFPVTNSLHSSWMVWTCCWPVLVPRWAGSPVLRELCSNFVRIKYKKNFTWSIRPVLREQCSNFVGIKYKNFTWSNIRPMLRELCSNFVWIKYKKNFTGSNIHAFSAFILTCKYNIIYNIWIKTQTNLYIYYMYPNLIYIYIYLFLL